MLLYNNFGFDKNTYAPPDAVVEPTSKGPLSVDDINNALKEPESEEEEVLDLPNEKKNKEIDKTDTETTEETEAETKTQEELDLEELEEELRDSPDDELDEIIAPVKLSEINKKYPNLFKDFPYLKSAYHREREFTELLPTIDDAREAVEAKGILERVDADIINGDLKGVLKSAQGANKEAFNKIVDNYLISLNEVSPEAYTHVAGNVVKATIQSMARMARANGDEKLMEAAVALNKHVFMTDTYEPPTKLSKDVRPEESDRLKEIEKKEKEFNERAQNSVRTDIDTRVNNLIKKTISVNIDPKNTMSAYIRRNAEREVFDEVDKLMKKDARTNSILNKLWDRAQRNSYNEEDTNKIRGLRLSRAKALLPAVINKIRKEALKGVTTRKEREVEEEEETTEKDTPRRAKSAPNKSDNNSNRRPEGKSTRDLLGYD